jgi:WD40 repeat protein
VSDDHLIIVWDVAQARQIMRFDANTDPVNAVVYSPDGQTVLTGLATGDVDMWDISGTLLREFSVHGKAVTGLALLPGGGQVLSSSRDGSVILWDTPTLDGLVRWIQANYVVHQFTCDERQQYNIDPPCVAATAVQSGGTQAATANPTSKPNSKPTDLPTIKPTNQPTLSATSTVAAPTKKPTQSSASF